MEPRRRPDIFQESYLKDARENIEEGDRKRREQDIYMKDSGENMSERDHNFRVFLHGSYKTDSKASINERDIEAVNHFNESYWKDSKENINVRDSKTREIFRKSFLNRNKGLFHESYLRDPKENNDGDSKTRDLFHESYLKDYNARTNDKDGTTSPGVESLERGRPFLSAKGAMSGLSAKGAMSGSFAFASRPVFDEGAPKNVSAITGNSAYLHCVVLNLANKSKPGEKRTVSNPSSEVEYCTNVQIVNSIFYQNM
ncbi:hypothetical protein SK128_009456 [Halocaridina rubra]|uniref:Uncharacterized protein n=1 Tax=Halocaridina rubra TaxID=373956 RepID=A0AAN8WTA7_HALRR